MQKKRVHSKQTHHVDKYELKNPAVHARGGRGEPNRENNEYIVHLKRNNGKIELPCNKA